jgi:hypothetical protein
MGVVEDDMEDDNMEQDGRRGWEFNGHVQRQRRAGSLREGYDSGIRGRGADLTGPLALRPIRLVTPPPRKCGGGD